MEAVIKLLGFEAFKTPEAEIKTFYQALKSMTRISKMQAVRYVWKISRSGDRKFYAPVDLMPSYIPADEKAAADEAEKEYMLMCQQVDKAGKELDRCIKDVRCGAGQHFGPYCTAVVPEKQDCGAGL